MRLRVTNQSGDRGRGSEISTTRREMILIGIGGLAAIGLGGLSLICMSIAVLMKVVK